MSISMYQASVPRLINGLTNLSHILGKAQAHAEAKKIDPVVFATMRLYPDMFPLSRQVQIACDVSKASLVFTYSTCFGSFIHKIAHKLACEAPEGCLVTSTTYAMTHPGLELLARWPAKTVAWTDVYVYRRVGTQPWPTPPEPYAYTPNLEEWEAKARALLKTLV